ncbi:MAG TPA: ATP-binding cassette domain-containing protein [Candidatus Eremiobacteraceae bacterium]|nr:ATP-binding cassette domain-containing protein [Candidatus Eremiobacteraceae bacterium]
MSIERTSDAETKIEVRDLHVWFGKRHAVRNVAFAVAEKKTVSFIGASGSGRSSLLRALNRLHDLDANARVEGSIKIDGAQILGPLVDVAALRRRVGMIFGQPATLPLSAFENVVFGMRASGIRDRAQLDAACERALRRVMLWEPIASSLGQSALSLPLDWQQRLCIARALAVEPEILLFDDPAVRLDPVAAQMLDDIIGRLRRDFTILLATNDLHQAARLSDITFYLVDGEIVETGETMSVFNRPTDARTEDFLAGRAW